MKLSLSAFGVLLVILVFQSCSSPDGQQLPAAVPTTSFRFQLNIENLRSLPSGEQYVLWFRRAQDSAWSSPTPLRYYFLGVRGGPDSLKFTSAAILLASDRALTNILLSIESEKIDSSRPAAPLASGTFNLADSTASLDPTGANGVGDYSHLVGDVTFTTKSSDTNRARSEYYLMKMRNGTPVAGLDSLPLPSAGWRYGLWMTDSNYFPMHQFFYGSFTSAAGFDSDHSHDAFPFPGGFKTAQLTDPGGRLRVTLEPVFAGDPPSTPSRVVLLELRLPTMIHDKETLPMANTWSVSAPHGTLRILH